jgi:uncharacterized membrane protein
LTIVGYDDTFRHVRRFITNWLGKVHRVHFYKIFGASFQRALAVLLVVAVLLPAPAFSLDSEDSQIFISGFNAYQRKDFTAAIDNMSVLLKKYPDTSLRDMALFWLARAYYRAGNEQEAAKHMAQFFQDYPNSPLKGTVEEGLVALAENYQKAQPLEAPYKASEKAAAIAAKVTPKAAETAAAEKVRVNKAAAEKAAADKVLVERNAAANAAIQRLASEMAAAEKAAAQKAAAEKSAAEKAAAEKAATEKAATEKAATEKAATEKAATEKAATAKAAAQNAAAQNAAAKAEERKVAKEKAAQKKLSAARKTESRKKGTSAAKRGKVIAAYQAVIDEFPGTAAASSASARLQQLAVKPSFVPKTVAVAPKQVEVAQVFNLEVAQYADLEVDLGPAPETQEAGKPFSIPFDVVNTGNGSDSFYLESGFPAEFAFHFAAAASPEVPINSTPTLAVGEKFRAVAVGTMPRGNIDGQKNSYPIKVVSGFAREVSQSKEIALVTSAPLLRAVVKSDKSKLSPGEKISYRISLLNIGTAPARGVTLRLNYPPQYEPVGFESLGFKQEAKAALVLDSLQLKSGEGKDFNLTFQLKDEALAEQELFVRADVINNDLDKKESFVSATSVVQRVSGVTARTSAEKLVVIPGQVVAIPLVVTNTGNVREGFSIKGSVAGGATYTFFGDLNRDGKRQSNEPIINLVGPLSPKEEAYVVLEIATPATANDRDVAPVSVFFEPEIASDKTATVKLQLTYSRPILDLSMIAEGKRLKPGEVSSLELNCINRGSNLAKQVTLQSILPAQLELVAADPLFSKSDNGIYIWRFDELGAGEKRNIRVTYRVKPGIAVGTNMQLKNLLNYQDPLGNTY